MSKVIQLSEATGLAIHSLILIAESDKDLLSVKKISEIMHCSENHLSKVLQRLVKEHIVKSIRGPKGGFLLTKKGFDVTFLEIYELIEGKFEENECPLCHDSCPFNDCLFKAIVPHIGKELKDFMKSKKD